ncbi:MAG: hypothetical protein IJH94_04185, partial [Clostridia bacterium]|nr:hypothetical protein [Clostridia bacterium]
SAVESIASGADKNFYFLGTEYQENENTTGIMTKNDNYPSFYPAFAAMSAMTELLGSGEYRGNINTGNARGYVFKSGTNDVIVAYSVSGSRTLNISGSYTKYDMFGNTLSGTSGSVTVSEEPVFIVMNGSVSGINPDNAHAPEKITPVVSSVGDHIVIRQDYSDDASTGARNGAYFIGANDNTVTVTVSNLNSEAVSGVLTPDCDSDWTFSPESRNISLDAYESGEYTFTINFDESDVKEALVTFKAVCGNIESSISAAKVKSGSGEYLKNAKRYWIDATKYSAKTGAYTQKQDSSAINGSAMRLLTQNYEQPLVRSTLTYDFSVPAGTYDVWMLMSDPNVNHMTKWKWRYELPDEYRRYTGSGTVAYEFGNQHKMYWYRVSSSKSLSKGKHSIVILSDALRGGTYNDYMLQIADSIVIVPTSDTWWDPRNKSNGENVIAFESRNFSSSFSFTNLREDIELPSKTGTGADVVWTSSDSGVIDANGHIQRGTETKSATLTATLTYDSYSTTIDFPVTVAAVSDLTITVTPVDESGNDITKYYRDRNNYVQISAVNPLSEDKSATVYIAGYEKRMNRFVLCDEKEIVAKSGEEVTPEIVLIQDDPSVSYYKIFAWNDKLQPLQDVLMLRTSSGSEYNDAWITISGNCGNPNETLTLTVAKDTGRSLSSMSKSEVNNNLCYIGEVTSDSDGNYSVRCKLTDAEGKYKINIKHSAGGSNSAILVK